ncbi:hypothetical protein GUITHDRAFT_145031 [Guillardia theta CCMP2712]|uniref:Uncharacterized protein n=1 Tax=Guillardia theta (strain CCMP2712) TaxID=905079 RepID=L1IN73_GUITC|nr:hypothetical protein GUITHDRAFT_145031 [Guillardia theta CCMP2712]EKX37329.1 hypothetical protein GUITHDRAFT_145031 [Guillardia theta CCMP2712]|eukprot:XP_005824309.1 hypothetical protein GUITHDRAFT_145031 [Guillardia theta CCMP2712]
MVSDEYMTRKQRTKMKKQMRQEQQKEQQERQMKADALLDEMCVRARGSEGEGLSIECSFDEIEAKERDLKKVTNAINKRTKSSNSTGLGKLPGTSILDMFITCEKSGKVKVQEICRVVGPFPNIKNELQGTWDYKTASSGFKEGVSSSDKLVFSYNMLIDGRDKVTTAETGFKVRSVDINVRYIDQDVMIMSLGEGLDSQLVWEREDNLDKEVGKLLRRDLTKEDVAGAAAPVNPIVAIAEMAKRSDKKKPWEFWK